MEEIINEIGILYPVIGFIGLSKKLGISKYKLKKIIKDNGILLKEKEKKVNFSNFNPINKKEVAYFLGFLWSDGSIYKNEISIEIKSNDEEDLLSVLNKFGIWNISRRIRNNKYKLTNIRTNNKDISSFLIENDYKDKSIKSPFKILNLINDELKPYFFRGLIDGDGCFCSKKNRSYFSITNNINQDWNSIFSLFDNLNIKYKYNIIERKSGNYSDVVISSKKEITKLGNYIYGKNFDNIGFFRKYNTYLEIKNRIVSKYSNCK
jgi:hypothetical protein